MSVAAHNRRCVQHGEITFALCKRCETLRCPKCSPPRQNLCRTCRLQVTSDEYVDADRTERASSP